MSRIQYFIKRTVISLFLVFLVLTGLFIFFRIMPGDYATLMGGAAADPEVIEQIREEWGLNEPIYVQYYHYLENLANGSFGESHRFGQPVWDVVRQNLINSLLLVAPAIIVVYLIGSIYGGIIGRAENSRLEKYGSLPPLFVGTIPDFFIGILLIFFFSSTLNIFPAQGMISSDTLSRMGENTSTLALMATGGFWLHYALPFTTIVLKYLYYPTLIMRSSVIDTRGQEFMFFHRITGVRKRLRFNQLLKHSSLPVITAFPISMAQSFSGLVLIEIVFNWPGIGKLMFDSVLQRDVPVIQFIFLLIAVWIIFANFAVDILYGIIDPRISIGEEGE